MSEPSCSTTCTRARPYVCFAEDSKSAHQLPAAGFELTVFSRWDSAQLPPSKVALCQKDEYSSEVDGTPLQFEFYNHTGDGFAGYHYDPLFPDRAPSQRGASSSGTASFAHAKSTGEAIDLTIEEVSVLLQDARHTFAGPLVQPRSEHAEYLEALHVAYPLISLPFLRSLFASAMVSQSLLAYCNLISSHILISGESREAGRSRQMAARMSSQR